ncbi:MAG: rhomboid family intramembrane serine protease [Alphaproteobacteria bacterium]|jgi:membrane associated rhomboid family serine protease|nr:rhomboid family intramembrane serine protease [Alphaproteobacteria bacterium]MBT4086115.1 rhomboid family intramembrane serine protease [Alphaproteobacteria bacterium]MBT4543732.1 rhomboid family intramembrane serine protease [Alphaproteobacteria bacterium]MBT6386491.1 rhomboid family intramembrane serine protease [Alphaproteobacteria bacterium]MBT7743977.1 rhomboid family intramembrane serine protease [Alphaproteobacteria bacterium]
MIPIHDDNPTSIRPYVTWMIIGICVFVFLWQVSLGGQGNRIVLALGLIPSNLLGTKVLPPEYVLIPAWLSVLTSMFMHGGWMHLIGNMVYLWVFGNNVEDAMGHKRFVVFYLLSGLGAAAGQILADPASTVPMIGASGAISGVLGAYLLLYPHARVTLLLWFGFLIYPIKIRALWVLGIWIGLQFFNAAGDDGGGGVAWWAHIGGFVTGMALIPFFRYRHVKMFGHGKEAHAAPEMIRPFKVARRRSKGSSAIPSSHSPWVKRSRPRGPWGPRR